MDVEELRRRQETQVLKPKANYGRCGRGSSERSKGCRTEPQGIPTF